MKFGMYVLILDPISAAYFINPSHQSVCLYVYPPTVASQRFGKHDPASTKNCLRRRFLCSPCRIKRKQVIGPYKNFLFLYVIHCYNVILRKVSHTGPRLNRQAVSSEIMTGPGRGSCLPEDGDRCGLRMIVSPKIRLINNILKINPCIILSVYVFA
jgi:hypothetical protein